jgi:hypothetical protein
VSSKTACGAATGPVNVKRTILTDLLMMKATHSSLKDSVRFQWVNILKEHFYMLYSILLFNYEKKFKFVCLLV